ncbi:MAG: cation:proton antiporter [Acidobacteriia bacterium]|nr:cation:proton antiporter [Terriglobia bacterium]
MLPLLTLVLQVAVILATCRVIAVLFRSLGQPSVVGEMFAGVLLGPSILGAFAPRLSVILFPPSSLASLNALSQIGLIIFMFLVGLGMNPSELRNHSHVTLLASHTSIALPFGLACVLSLYLYPRLSDNSVSFTSFSLFMGAAMSITAFPVLARILSERNMLQSRLGNIAIACAAVDDVTGWCILAYIVLLIRARSSAASVWLTLAGALAFALLMVGGVRRLVGRFETLYRERGELTDNAWAIMLLLVFLSALCTEWLGIHLLFGAFLMGVIMPRDGRFVRYVIDRFEVLSVVLLLPLFFAFTGLRTSIALVKGQTMWGYCALIILTAIAGKLGGSMAASRMMGLPVRESAGLGILMNTRGLMELVILNIGLDLKVISPALFSMMVLMALVTTFMTTPLLKLIYREEPAMVASAEINENATASSGISAA